MRADPSVDWRARNVVRLSADDLARGYDAGGHCAAPGHGPVVRPDRPRAGAGGLANRWRRFAEWQ